MHPQLIHNMPDSGLKINAIVLAAGLGTRLRPLTVSTPKPLLPICNKPLLELILDKLDAAGVSSFAINTHYCADKIDAFVKASSYSSRIKTYNEAEILGTGGPLVNARAFLSEGDAFLLHNGDILSNIDAAELVEHHRKSGKLMTMVLIDGPENRVLADDNGVIRDILGKLGAETEGAKLYTYACMAVFSPAIFKYLPENPCFSSLIDAILGLIRENPGMAGAYYPENPYWNDIGSIEQYFNIHKEILLSDKNFLPGLKKDGSIVADSTALIDESVKFSGFACIGRNVRIGKNTFIANSVIMDGAVIPDGDFRNNQIISPDYIVHRDIRKLESLSILKENKWELSSAFISSLVEQGSDRHFYRLAEREKSAVLMCSPKTDLDFDRYITIGSFLNRVSHHIPKIYAYSYEELAVLMEDLGNKTVYDIVNLDKAPLDLVRSYYKEIAVSLAEFQVKATRAVEAENFSIRDFDYEYLRWETSYFKENFLENLAGLPKAVTESLDDEFHRLAEFVFAQPRILMHRDFQSQNILIHDGKVRFVDFQGARKGPMAYDIMSLLRDPYIKLIDGEMRDDLLKTYLDAFNELSGMMIPEERFRIYAISAGLQRNMQALGAYGFLSLKKRKMKYLKYVPHCLSNLREGLIALRDNPEFLRMRNLDEICHLPVLANPEILEMRLETAEKSFS